jgi:hypothetical protein
MLGMRNLQSLGVIPVCRPYVKINLNSLKSISEAEAGSQSDCIITEPKQSGCNPNLGTVLK